MTSGIEVGVGYFSILPETSKIAPGIRAALGDTKKDAEKAGKEAGESFGSKMSAGIKGFAGAAVGLAIGGALVKGFSDALNQDALNAKLTAQLGLSAKQSEKAGQVAGNLFGNGYGEGIEHVNEAIRGVLQNVDGMRGASEKALERISGKALTVAQTFDQDLGGVTRAVGQMMRTGLAKNADQALDVITRGFQTGADKSEDFLDTLNEYGTQFRKLGLDGKTATGLISQGLRAGARDSDIVADALKEFSIRAVDGSDASQVAFEKLGLNAQKLTSQIAGGGKGASEGLQLVLDKLRDMKDPVAREAAAVGLFGTQAEDLGKALFKLDPSKAAEGMGKIAGATDKANKALNDTPTAVLATFMRQIQQGFVDVMAGTVIPLLDKLAPAVAEIGAVFRELMPHLQAFWGFLKQNKDIITALAVTIGILVLNMKLQATWTARATIMTKIQTAATKAWAVAQRALNLALMANPIGIVIAVLAVLIGAFIIAYKRSDEFRRVVDRAWAAIKQAVKSAWEGTIRPALVAFWSWIQNDLMPVINRLWNDVVKPVFAAIGKAIAFAWRNIIWPLLKAWWAYLTNVLFPVLNWLWDRVVKPVMANVGKGIKDAWENVIRPAFSALRDFVVDTLVPAFRRGIDAIGRIWEGLKSAASGPVRFLIETVYMGGIRPLVNGILDKLGVEFQLPPLYFGLGNTSGNPTHMATGGVLPGYTPGRDVHDFYSPTAGRLSLSGGEAIMRPEFTRLVGGPKGVDTLNAWAKKGQNPFVAKGTDRRFAGGGVYWPVPGRDTSTYPGHDGVDINRGSGWDDYGDPIVAFRDGVISYVGSGRGYGSAIFQSGHGYGTVVYGHTSSQAVRAGQTVSGGQLIGRVGNTGNSSAPHLHFGHPGGTFEGAMALLRGALTSGGAGGGGGGNPFSYLINRAVGYLSGKAKDLLGQIPGLKGTAFGQIAFGAGTKVIDELASYITSNFGGATGPGPGGQTYSGSAVQIVKQMAAARGWTGAQWSALYELVRRESSWNPNAANPDSSARGLFQKMTSLHGPIEPTVQGQAAWGLNYIAGRYGSPIAALAFHNAHGSYKGGGVLPKLGVFDSGGVLEPGALAYNASSQPEAVFNQPQLRDLVAGASEGGARDRLRRGDTLVLQIGREKFEAVVGDIADDRIDLVREAQRAGGHW